ncbi:MAG: ATP-binding protein [Pyrinomonadaceae bacterium]
MNNLQKDFLQRSIANLENLTASAKKEESLSPEFAREIFRMLHTIKGTSQTFGFSTAANLAHELENLLSAKDVSADFKNILLEGFALLIDSFRHPNESGKHESFIDKIRRIVPVSSPLQNSFAAQIPPEISKQLSEYERNAYLSAVGDGKKIFCVKADFDLADFASGFKNLKENLSLQGEIIATLPAPQIEKGKIGFLIYFAGQEIGEEISQNFPSEIIGRAATFSDDVKGILEQVAAHGKDLARKLGKEIQITVSADEIELSAEKSKLIFDILLHLVRNAVDHAIEKPDERRAKGKDASGTIEISLKANENDLALSVKDDGKGIDAEKIEAKAVEKSLISAGEILTGRELLGLIFLHEFSTRETISEISGRGVGLDAVKDLAENGGGKISVESRKDAGMTFEIILPKDEYEPQRHRDTETEKQK